MASKQGTYTLLAIISDYTVLCYIGYYQPTLRVGHSTVVTNDNVYTCGQVISLDYLKYMTVRRRDV